MHLAYAKVNTHTFTRRRLRIESQIYCSLCLPLPIFKCIQYEWSEVEMSRAATSSWTRERKDRVPVLLKTKRVTIRRGAVTLSHVLWCPEIKKTFMLQSHRGKIVCPFCKCLRWEHHTLGDYSLLVIPYIAVTSRLPSKLPLSLKREVFFWVSLEDSRSDRSENVTTTLVQKECVCQWLWKDGSRL